VSHVLFDGLAFDPDPDWQARFNVSLDTPQLL
jgi:hypothetical protein